DQALVIHLKGKGLVIISGCSHSGIINIIHYARKITGVTRVYGVMGGFHLTGPAFEPIIGETIEKLKAINPAIIFPMHCTGWKATTEIAEQMPRQFVLSSVGTTLTL
ncbi:MAG: MBL fold metallo-hydrolase, partial [Proteobacteria bacterium]|nr:MBL fold metallo-hydrolase [Pseudomonadota bacterium]